MRFRSDAFRLCCVLAATTTMSACAFVAPRSRAAGPRAGADGIVFRFYSPGATRVQLAGSWPENNWARGDGTAGEADIGLMSDDNHDGIWELNVALGPGRYHYLFWINETTWRLDPGNPEEDPVGPVGRASRIIVVSREGVTELR